MKQILHWLSEPAHQFAVCYFAILLFPIPFALWMESTDRKAKKK